MSIAEILRQNDVSDLEIFLASQQLADMKDSVEKWKQHFIVCVMMYLCSENEAGGYLGE